MTDPNEPTKELDNEKQRHRELRKEADGLVVEIMYSLSRLATLSEDRARIAERVATTESDERERAKWQEIADKERSLSGDDYRLAAKRLVELVLRAEAIQRPELADDVVFAEEQFSRVRRSRQWLEMCEGWFALSKAGMGAGLSLVRMLADIDPKARTLQEGSVREIVASSKSGLKLAARLACECGAVNNYRTGDVDRARKAFSALKNRK